MLLFQVMKMFFTVLVLVNSNNPASLMSLSVRSLNV